MSNESIHRSIRSLVVVAHPDDETLYFFSGLKELSELTRVDLFCITYEETSLRGEELKIACKNLRIKIHFGGIKDLGIRSCLQDVEKTLSQFIDQQTKDERYEMAITHPFHGGEKPHPHHIQAFYALRDLCLEKGIAFGFFSEKQLNIPRLDKFSVVFSRKFEVRLLIKRIWNVVRNWVSITFFLNQVSSALIAWIMRRRPQKFSLQTYSTNVEEKKAVLKKYKSQMQFLAGYKTFERDTEYLYLEK